MPLRHRGKNLLTSREIQILELKAQGLTNKEVAFNLGISIQTVKNHISSSLRKLGIDGSGIVYAFIELGWLRVEPLPPVELLPRRIVIQRLLD